MFITNSGMISQKDEDDFMTDETDKETVKRFNIASTPGAIGGGLEIIP